MTHSQKIHKACSDGDIDTVKLLLQEKCDIEACDENNRRPVHIACDKGHVGIVKLLLEEKCNIEACDKKKWRPIHFATQLGSMEIVKLLIEHKCDIDALTKDDKSPLKIAIDCNHKELTMEIFHEKLIRRVKDASNAECVPDCDHTTCLKNLIPFGKLKPLIIGRGSFGKVYKITDPETNLTFALKAIDVCNDYASRPPKNFEDDINKFQNLIKHPRIMEYYGSLVCPPKMYVFMELFPKGSLDHEIRKEGYLPEDTIIRYSRQILEALEFLHANKIIHRDIKPRKILLDEYDGIKLCGFGLSRVLTSAPKESNSDNDEKSNKLKANTFCGTICYMAPEVIISEGYNLSADIWSLGATITHMLTGHPPYYDLPQPAVMFRIATKKEIDYVPIPTISDKLVLFIKEILNPDPIKRATATDLLKFLIDHDM